MAVVKWHEQGWQDALYPKGNTRTISGGQRGVARLRGLFRAPGATARHRPTRQHPLVPLVGIIAAIGLVAAPDAVLADTPRSAIPWLSESLATSSDNSSSEPSTEDAPATQGIQVSPLGAVSRDGVGIIAPEQSGLPRRLWQGMDAPTLRDAIASHPDRGVPATRALFKTLLLAETDPPAQSLGGEAVLLARLDRLLAFGALDEAKAMVERASPETPELFRRWFDVALLLNAAEEPCATLAERASLSPTLPARVFCLARGGDWNAAEITSTLGQDTGSISETQELLLARFLDPAIFEDDPPPPVTDPLTPLEFLMREAVALPRPTGPLPVAFLHADLGEYTPIRMRIEAAERLYLAGGIGHEDLFAAYRAGEPAASGATWDRAAAVQALDETIADGTAATQLAAMQTAAARLQERDLLQALALHYAEELTELSEVDGLDGENLQLLTALLLLAGNYDQAAMLAGTPDAGAIAVAAGLHSNGGSRYHDLIEATLLGTTMTQSSTPREAGLEEQALAGEVGATILAALDLLAEGTGADPASLRAGLYGLRLADQTTWASRVAVETLVLSAFPASS